MLHLVAPTIVALTPISLYTSDLCLNHNPGNRGKNPDGSPNVHPEKVTRLSALLEAMRSEWKPEFGDALDIVDTREADVTNEQLERVHTEQYIALVDRLMTQTQSAPRQMPDGTVQYMRCNLDRDTVISHGTRDAAMRAAGLVCAAVDDLLAIDRRQQHEDAPARAFVMVRPPGHHASAGKGGGFCIFNNVLVGVAHAQKVHGLGKVAILDFDVHHGNGDEDLVFCDPTRLYASSHESELWPFTGATAGCDGMHGQIINAPLPPQAGPTEFRDAWAKTLLPAVKAFEPEAIFLSAGFDAHAGDPLASMTLAPQDFAWLTTEVVKLGKPVISVLEGGYNVETLPRCVKAHVEALMTDQE